MKISIDNIESIGDNWIDNYVSPVKLFVSDFNNSVEDEVYTQTIKFAVDIDKEEMLKALKYDRDQYRKGWEAAKEYYKKPGRWRMHKVYEYPAADGGMIYEPVVKCSECGMQTELYARYEKCESYEDDYPNFCPYCGADMRMANQSEKPTGCDTLGEDMET